MLVTDADGTLVALNAAAERLLPGITAGVVLAEAMPGWPVGVHDGVLEGVRGAGEPWERGYEVHPVAHDDGTTTWWLTENTDARLAETALRTERRRAQFLAEASTALLGSLNLQRCMQVAGKLAVQHLADAALLITPAGRHRVPAMLCVRDREPEEVELAADLSEVPGLAEALQGFPPVPSRWIDPASAPEWLIPAGFGDVGSIVVTPLPGHGVPAGALVLLRKAERAAFSEDEEIFARLFAARSGVAMSAARMFAQQSSMTETLMRELLPPAVREVAGAEFAGRYRAALDSERVGGDFYDVYPAADDSQESLVVLGDVCGKGIEAAVLTGKVRNTLHALLPLASDHHRVLSMLNDALLSSHHTRFVTLALASVSRLDSGLRMRLTCAGHLPPLIVRANGEVEVVETIGTVVGVLPEIATTTVEVTLAPGETCLLYTDGITEARGGPLGSEMFGEDRLHEALTRCAGMPAEAIVEHVHMLAAEWARERSHDDMALVAVTAPRGQRLSAVGGSGRGRYTAA
ncbi:SpoIIE family protein phosphatase [Amycolatopsis sp. FU40]|uniref:GAF domain-containing SpoIIE family protein phosphatase n=1 Tax=Amycolatopsis sp. FU40 TaxID=2914159 RepID=UPI001F22B17D|nr:GAF domain-containing SpoIIE family protein phosphatase [Amycolatopsis sp. FU40]UKD57935.1 SpoIIE family protein phosphatase [Amycolatopsis sp. FU40]